MIIDNKKRASLNISREAKDELDGIKHTGQSYDGLIRELLMQWKRQHDGNGGVKKRNSDKKLLHGNESGFTLIEILISIAVLGIIVIAITMGLVTAFKAYGVSNKHATAMALAQTQLEYIDKQDYLESYAFPPDYTVPAGYTVDPVTIQELETGKLQEITVQVKYEGDTVYTLSSYKANQ